MELKNLQLHWDEFGRTDPLWAILSDPDKRNRKWNREQFFKTGEEEIDRVLGEAEALGRKLEKTRALDFGCGVGRLTQALGRHFELVDGVDIAPSMIKLANEFNGHADKCRYHVNAADDLSLFESGSFDFIYSNIVLQHMRAEYSRRYIEEFVRLIRPGGLIVFQIPAQALVAAEEPQDNRTRCTEALPDGAFAAQITVPDQLNAKPGTEVLVPVTVRNTSDVTWPALGDAGGHFQIKVGNHWLSRWGKMLAQDDGRAALPHDVAPGESITVSLPVTTPNRLGRFVLEVDLVQELVAWFKDRGSPTARTDIRMRDTSRLLRKLLTLGASERPGRAWAPPRMEMHCVPKDDVLALISSVGAEAVHVVEDQYAGSAWQGFRYFVTK